MTVPFTPTDVPAVPASALAAAVRLWLRELPRGPVAVVDRGRGVCPVQSLERKVVDLFGQDTRTSLAVVLRLRCLMAVLSCRRFEAEVRSADEAWLALAIAAAAGLRVNAQIGFSPVRLAWAIASQEAAAAAMARAA